MSRTFEALRLRSLELSNRIVVSPMCQYSAVEGDASRWHSAHLGGLAIGGAGLIFVEATAVTEEGRITPGCLGLYSDANDRALADVIKTVREVSSVKLGIQLSHAGRKGSSATPWDGGMLIPLDQGGWTPLAPSAAPHKSDEPPPLAMKDDDFETILSAFVSSATRAVRLGFEAIELHCAHGYLLHQFLSPVSNRRADQYGGSLENRMRFPLEVFAAIRAVVPEGIPVGVRVSSSDWLEHLDAPSWRLEDTIAFSIKLKTLGCDWIDASSGGISPLQKIPVGPGYQVHFARAIKEATGMTTIAVGMITEPAQAEAILTGGSADLVALARAMLFDPHWAWRAAQQLEGTVAGPKQYWRSLPSGSGRIFGEISIGMR